MPKFSDKISALCHRLSTRGRETRIVFPPTLSQLSKLDESNLADAFILRLNWAYTQFYTLELKKTFDSVWHQPSQDLKQKTQHLLTLYKWNEEFNLQANKKKINALIALSNELKQSIRQEFLTDHYNPLKKQLADMKLKLTEFHQKSSYRNHAVFQQIQQLLNDKNPVEALEKYLTTFNSSQFLPNNAIYAWNAFTGFFANRFGKEGAYQQRIALYNEVVLLEKILKHHIQQIKENPCFILSISENEKQTLETKSLSLDISSTKEFKFDSKNIEISTQITSEHKDKKDTKEIKEIKGTSASKQSHYLNSIGIPTASENMNKPRATYPMKQGNQIQHYSNTSDDKEGKQGAYADIMKAISQAKHIIFIAGWLFEPQIHYPHKLIQPKTLGEILIDKAIENPKLEIAILVWRRPAAGPFSIGGSIDDRKALAYLKQLAKKRGLSGLPANLQFRKVRRTGISWSHHQKFLVMDIPVIGHDSAHELTAFYGSADLAGGKFDWHEHPILDTDENKAIVTTVFRNAGHFRSLKPFNQKTPRLAWREVLSQLKGPVAKDFLYEFVTRWCALNQGALSNYIGSQDKQERVLNRYLMIRQERLFDHEIKPSQTSQHQSIWNAQLVRSSEASMYAAPWRLHKSYEKSIHKANLQAIHQAEKFIYIETQYITQTAPHQTKNRIPQAIVNRIIEQHKAKKPFHVFIVLPLLPNGDAGGKVFVEPVRYLQWQTMRWMMQEIEDKTGVFWGEYLSFYFFGQWLERHHSYLNKVNNPKTTRAELSTYSGHAAVYIHSKLMIVDDRVIINGSANLTERSLAGPYDSEIAVYQTPTPGCEAKCIAETRRFRRDIWKGYFGKTCLDSLDEKGFANPERPEYVRIIQQCARNNLSSFSKGKEASSANSGLLLTWPFKHKKGCIGEMESDCEFLPETLLKDIDNNNDTFHWFPNLKSKPIFLKVAQGIKHKAFD